MNGMPVSRIADPCPECGEWIEPAVVLHNDDGRGVDCVYTCGCHASTWAAAIAYPVDVDS